MRKKYNRFDLTSYEYGVGYTSKDEPFYFDKEDFQKIKNICWFKDTKTGYIRGSLSGLNKKVSLHRIVMEADKDDIIDHINHDLTDNRKSNLRKCTRSQNAMNSHIRSDNKSGCSNVYYDKNRSKWGVQISFDKRRISIGRFDSYERAVEEQKKIENQMFADYSYENSMKIGEKVGKVGD